MVIWIIGKSGAGKSFYAKKLLNKLKGKKILIDGDEIRKFAFLNKLGFSKKDRKLNAQFIVRLCSFLERKGFKVICSILSIFPEMQKKNRKIFQNYYQIYLKANPQKLISRNNKGIYSKNKNIVGIDIKFPTPYKSDLIFNNYFDLKYKSNIIKIIKLLKHKD